MVRGSWFVVRGLGFVAKDAMEIAADSDCRRLRCAVAAERSEGRATHRERGDSRAKRVPSDNRQSSAAVVAEIWLLENRDQDRLSPAKQEATTIES